MINNDPFTIGPLTAGILAIHPALDAVSMPRLNMWASQQTQILEISGGEAPRYASGTEVDFAKYADGVVLKHDTVLVGDPIPNLVGYGTNTPTWQYLALIEIDGQRKVDYIEINNHTKKQYKFGFKNKIVTPITNKTLLADTRLTAPPSYNTETESWDYGVNLNVMLSTHPYGIEDGYVISKSAAQKMQYYTYKEFKPTIEPKSIPLNTYGKSPDEYKVIPDIGDMVRDDGVLFASRHVDPDASATLLTKRNLMRIRHNSSTDKVIYVTPGSEVVSIDIWKGTNIKPAELPLDYTTQQLEKLWTNQKEQDRRLIEAAERLVYNAGDKITFTEAASIRLTMAYKRNPNMAYTRLNVSNLHNVNRMVAFKSKQNVSIGAYQVSITLRKLNTPRRGNKITDRYGGKGIIVGVWDDEHMPIDVVTGVRAEVLGDCDGSIKRLNPGRVVESTICAIIRDSEINWRKQYNAGVSDLDIRAQMGKMVSIINPDIAEHVMTEDGLVDEPYFQSIMDGQPIQMFTGGSGGSDVLRKLNEVFPLETHHVRLYNPNTGMYDTTEDPIMIGTMYFVLLEKIADEATSTSSAMLTPFGTPSKLSAFEKQYYPASNRATRLGEAEERWFASVLPEGATIKLKRRSGDPTGRRSTYRSIFTTDKPSDIYDVLDTPVHNQYSNPRTLEMAHHLAFLGGSKFEWSK